MNVLEARRRLLDGEIKKRTAEGEDISVRSVARMRPGLTLYGKSEQETTTGAQLYDSNLSEDNKYQNCNVESSNFAITNNEQFWITGKIQIKPSTQYIITPATIFYGAYYEDIDTPIKTTLIISNVFTAPENANYVCISYKKTVVAYGTNIMLNSGSTALPWEPYTGGAPSPSPDYPQEIKSAGDSGTINVSLSNGGSQSQTIPVQTPNGLPGIPVSSGGNHTDANGQQWACDEVDFKRGKYVQRCAKEVLTGTPNFIETSDVAGRFMWDLSMKNTFLSGSHAALSNFAKWSYWGIPQSARYTFALHNRYLYFSPITTMTAEEVNAMFAEMIASDNPPYIIGQLATPIETPLSPEGLSAYAALRTYSPTTVVTNDAGAWMKLGYKTKKSLEVTTI